MADERQYSFPLERRETHDDGRQGDDDDAFRIDDSRPMREGWSLFLFFSVRAGVSMGTDEQKKKEEEEEEEEEAKMITSVFKRAVVYSSPLSIRDLELREGKALERAAWTDGPVVEFKLEAADPMEELKLESNVRKIRLGHDDDDDDDAHAMMMMMMTTTATKGSRLSLVKALVRHTTRNVSYEFHSAYWNNQESLSSSMRDGWIELPCSFGSPSFHAASETSLIEMQTAPSTPVKEYKVILKSDVTRTTFTGADNPVFFANIHGTNGDTGVRRLLPVGRDASAMTFCIRAVDLFKLECLLIGHLELENARPDSSAYWYLEGVSVATQAGDRTIVVNFHHDGWIERSDDGKFSRILYPKEPAIPPATETHQPEENMKPMGGIEWKGVMRTGKFYDDDDDDDDDDGGNRNNNNSNNILYIDEFPRKQPAHRNLPVFKSYPEPLKGNLVLFLYDDLGRTGPMKVELTSQRPTDFEPDEEIDFKVTIARNVQRPYKVRIGAEEEEENWILGNVTLEDPTNGNVYKFEFEERLIRNGHFDGWLEAALSEFEGEEDGAGEDAMMPRIPLILYDVYTCTSHREPASRDLQVSLNVIGQRGDTGLRRLSVPVKRPLDQPLFLNGQVDHFQIEAVDLKDPKEICLSGTCSVECHWLINRVIITWEDPVGQKEIEFFLNCLMEFGPGTKPSEKSFKLDHYKPDTWMFYLEVKTSAEGKNEKNYKLPALKLVVYGSEGWTKEMKLIAVETRAESKQDAETARMPFRFQASFYSSIGDFYKVRVGIPEEVLESIFLDVTKAYLRNESQGITYAFEMNGYLEKNDRRDGWKEAPVLPFADNLHGRSETAQLEACQLESCQVVSYGIQIQTGKLPEMSTDDDIFIEIFGTRGSTGKRKLLENLGGHQRRFGAGQLDVFLVEAVDLLKIERINVGRMNASPGGWFIDEITVVILSDDAIINYKFNCSSWITKDESTREFFLTDFEVVNESLDQK